MSLSRTGAPLFDDPEALCRRVLAPYSRVLAQVPRNAWKLFSELPDQARIPLERRPIQRANLVHAYMQEEADAQLLGMSSIRITPNSHSSGYLIEDQVFVRFKHLDDQGLSRNYPTKRAQLFNANESLPGIPASALRVDIGYQLNDVETQIRDVRVVHRSVDKVEWSFSLDEPTEVIALPVQLSLDEQLEQLPQVRARGERSRISDDQSLQATDDE